MWRYKNVGLLSPLGSNMTWSYSPPPTFELILWASTACLSDVDINGIIWRSQSFRQKHESFLGSLYTALVCKSKYCMQLLVQQCSSFSNNLLKLIGYRTQLAGGQVKMFQLASKAIYGRRQQNSLAVFLMMWLVCPCKELFNWKGAKRVTFTNYLEVILTNNL